MLKNSKQEYYFSKKMMRWWSGIHSEMETVQRQIREHTRRTFEEANREEIQGEHSQRQKERKYNENIRREHTRNTNLESVKSYNLKIYSKSTENLHTNLQLKIFPKKSGNLQADQWNVGRKKLDNVYGSSGVQCLHRTSTTCQRAKLWISIISLPIQRNS